MIKKKKYKLDWVLTEPVEEQNLCLYPETGRYTELSKITGTQGKKKNPP